MLGDLLGEIAEQTPMEILNENLEDKPRKFLRGIPVVAVVGIPGEILKGTRRIHV